MTDEKLKLCPFCGGEARLKRINDSYYVMCDNGDCEIEPRTLAYGVKEKPISAWNRRVKDDYKIRM